MTTQAPGKISVIVKNGVQFDAWDGTRQTGNGATNFDVTRRTAVELGREDLVVAGNVLVRWSDWNDLVKPSHDPTDAQTP